MTVGDFNADGDPDLAVTTHDDVSVLLGGAGGGFGAQTGYAAGEQPQSVAVGDFDGDGAPDLAVPTLAYSQGQHRLSVLLGAAGGAFAGRPTFPVGVFPNSSAVADFDADGDPDLVTANSRSDDVSVLLNTSNVFTCGGVEASIVGTDGPDDLVGTAGADVVALLEGDDRFRGGGGGDTVCGGRGVDTLNGDDGDDTLSGGADHDTLRGSEQDDTLRGQRSNDELHGGAGAADVCNGGPGTDTADLDCETMHAIP